MSSTKNFKMTSPYEDIGHVSDSHSLAHAYNTTTAVVIRLVSSYIHATLYEHQFIFLHSHYVFIRDKNQMVVALASAGMD